MRLSAPRRLASAAAMLGAALAAGGCSSIQLDSLLSKQDAGTTSPMRRSNRIEPAHAAAAPVSDADLAYARAAAADVLARGGKVNSVPWRNPQTGSGGNIMPLATAHEQGGVACRDFLASYVRGASQAWLQGSACRSVRGEWQVKSLKPLQSG